MAREMTMSYVMIETKSEEMDVLRIVESKVAMIA